MRKLANLLTKKEFLLGALFLFAALPILFSQQNKNSVSSENTYQENAVTSFELNTILSFFVTFTGITSIYNALFASAIHTMAIVTCNVNSDRSVDDLTHAYHTAFPELSYNQRFSLNAALFESFIAEEPATIFNLQEMSDAALALFQNFFKEKGFTSIATKYAPNKGAFNFIIAYDPRYYEQMSEPRQLYYTQSGNATVESARNLMTLSEKKAMHMGIEFERSAFTVLLRDYHGKIFRITNTHPSLDVDHRMQCMAALVKFLKNLSDPILASLSMDERKKIIEAVVGDMNMFAPGIPSVYYPQAQVLQDGGLAWLSKDIKNSGLSFPYDILRHLNDTQRKELNDIVNNSDLWPTLRQFFMKIIHQNEIDILWTALDGIFFNAKETRFQSSVSAYAMLEGSRIETSALTDMTLFKKRVLDHFDQPPKIPAPLHSDHFALRAKVNFN